MSPETHDLTWAELDRLADYTADALSPAQAAEVARLVATDPRWSAAHRALRRADVAVRADLAVAARVPTPVPGDVAAQIDAALHRLAPAGATVISIDAARAKRRRSLTLGIAAAAATIVAVLGGIVINTGLIQTQSPTTANAPGDMAERNTSGDPFAAPSVPPPALGSNDQIMVGLARVLASGTDYRLDTLPALAAMAPEPNQTNDSKSGEFFASGEAPGALAPLNTPAALEACLRAVVAQHPGVAVVVDYARFEGQPAVVIVVRQGGGSSATSRIVVVGPECGQTGTAERAAVSGG